MNPLLNTFVGTVRNAGLTNPYGLAAVAATGQAESGFSPDNVYRTWSDPSQRGQAGMAGGVMSWRNERLRNMQDFARNRGDDPSRPSVATQALFFAQEDPALVAKLQSAKSVEEAQGLMNGAWKFAGYDRPGGEASRRLSTARSFLGGDIGSDAGSSSSTTPRQTAGGIGSDATALARLPPAPEAGTETLVGGTATDTISPSVIPQTEGGLGGLGGFLKSDGFGDILRAVSYSLMTSNRSNPLANVPTYLSAFQRQREATNERELIRQQKLNEQKAFGGVLELAGLPSDQAATFSSNPAAARVALDAYQTKRDRADYATFAGKLAPSDPSSPPGPDAFTSQPAAPGPIGSNALMSPASLTDSVPAAASPPATVTAQPNQTIAHRSRLQAENDRLFGLATQARTDDERRAAELAIRANQLKLDYIDKILNRQPTLTSIYTDDGREQKGYLDQNNTFVPVGGAKPAGLSGGGNEFGLQPIYGRDANGKVVIGQAGKNGTVIQSKVPNGFTPLSPEELYQGRAFGTANGKNIAANQAALPGAQSMAQTINDQVESLKNDAYLPSMVGPIDSRLPNWSGDAARVQSKMDQLQGGAFLQARQMLKGGGAITDFEGKKAEEAFAAMNAAQNLDDYKKNLDLFNANVQSGLAKLQTQAGGSAATPGGTSAGTTAAPSPGGSMLTTTGGLKWRVK